MTDDCSQFLEQSLRHPELVSGSTSPRSQAVIGARWMLKRVQHDGGLGGLVAYWRQSKIHREINPLRVFRFNEIYLPRAVPVLELLFACYRVGHILEHFKAYQAVDGVFRGMSRHHVITVLIHALDQVRRYADVQRSVGLAREYVDARVFRLLHGLCMDARWTLKQVQGDDLGAFGRE